MAVFLTHSNPEQLDLQLDDHWFRMPPDEPFEVDSRFYADKLLEIYGPVYGLVELVVTKSRLGISVDMEGGAAASQAALKKSYMRAVRHYVDDQLTDRIRKGLPALPPQGRAALAIQELHIDLKKRYGFSPVDWEGEEAILNVPGAGVTLPAPAPIDDTRVNFLEAQVAKSNRIIAALAKALGVDPEDLEDDALTEGVQQAGKKSRKGKNQTQDQPETPVEA